MDTFNPSTWEGEARGSLWIQGQLVLYSWILSQKEKKIQSCVLVSMSLYCVSDWWFTPPYEKIVFTIGFRGPSGPSTHRCSRFFYKMMWYLLRTRTYTESHRRLLVCFLGVFVCFVFCFWTGSIKPRLILNLICNKSLVLSSGSSYLHLQNAWVSGVCHNNQPRPPHRLLFIYEGLFPFSIF